MSSGIVPIAEIRPATLIGKGKVDEIAGRREGRRGRHRRDGLRALPVQQRNLEKAWQAKVLDRTGLILEIFGGARRPAKARSRSSLRI